MAILVTKSNRKAFSKQLREMHRDRKRVFIDGLKWDLDIVSGELEIDEFDTDEAIYLIAVEPLTNSHMASVRLLPTTQPHLMDTVFPHLCEDGVPRGPRIFEMSRLCATPSLEPQVAATIRFQLLLALIEYALEHKIEQLTAVCAIKFLSKLLAVGWDCKPLGAPQIIGGELTGALVINVTPATLAILYDRFGVRPAAAA